MVWYLSLPLINSLNKTEAAMLSDDIFHTIIQSSQYVNQLYPTRMLRADGHCGTVHEHTRRSIIVDLMV